MSNGSDTLRSSSMVTRIHSSRSKVAVPLALLVLMFCLSIALPATGYESGCGGLESAGRVCAQSGGVTPVLAVVQDQPPIRAFALPGVPLAPDGASVEPVQHHADPSAPRAPPRLP